MDVVLRDVFSVCRACIISYAVMFFATALRDLVRLHVLKSCNSFANLCCKNTTLNIEVINLHEME